MLPEFFAFWTPFPPHHRAHMADIQRVVIFYELVFFSNIRATKSVAVVVVPFEGDLRSGKRFEVAL